MAGDNSDLQQCANNCFMRWRDLMPENRCQGERPIDKQTEEPFLVEHLQVLMIPSVPVLTLRMRDFMPEKQLPE